jgi:hypothetical protein
MVLRWAVDTTENDKDQEHRMSDETKPQDGKAMSPASAGSQLREQIAALVHDAMRFDREAKTPKWQGGNSYAESRARQAAWQIATMFQPTLTDAEREAIEKAIGRELDAKWYGGPEPDRVITLRALLTRLN